jgi:acetoin utilization deacetylase AcuC-like enzyme
MFQVFDPRQLSHAPAGELQNGAFVAYNESPARAGDIAARLGPLAPAQDFGLEPIARVHDDGYLDFLRTAHARWTAAGRSGDAIAYTFPVVHRRELDLERIDGLMGRYSLDAGTPVAAGTWDAAWWSAQTALTALRPLLEGAEQTAFALCRPPGHHAGRDYCGGYCYINNAAVAARAAADAGHASVAILDIDYHHGNGTQDIFLEDGGVFFASIHADPATDYPFYWGHADEAGRGEGRRTTLNLPLARGADLPIYAAALGDNVSAFLSGFGG